MMLDSNNLDNATDYSITRGVRAFLAYILWPAVFYFANEEAWGGAEKVQATSRICFKRIKVICHL